MGQLYRATPTQSVGRIRYNRSYPLRSNTRPKLKNLDKRIKKINSKMELKFNDVFQSSISIDDTAGNGVMTLLNGIATGDSNITRDGNEIFGTSIQFRGVYSSDGDSLGITLLRTIVFWDSQSNGAAPTQGQLLELGIVTSALFAPYNMNNQKRFKIVYDKLITLNPQAGIDAAGTTTDAFPNSMVFKKKIKLGRIVKYSGATAAIGDIASNSLYVYQVSNQAAEFPLAAVGYRFIFKDN